jgi:hypothetical protein
VLTDLYVVCVTTQNVLSRDPVPRRSKAARPKNGFSTLYFTSGSPQAPQNDNRISRDVFHFKRCQQLGPTFFCTLPQDHTDLRLNFDLYICISAKLSRCRASIALHHNAIVSPQESPSERHAPRKRLLYSYFIRTRPQARQNDNRIPRDSFHFKAYQLATVEFSPHFNPAKNRLTRRFPFQGMSAGESFCRAALRQ